MEAAVVSPEAALPAATLYQLLSQGFPLLRNEATSACKGAMANSLLRKETREQTEGTTCGKRVVPMYNS
jgi:hypothetical protein